MIVGIILITHTKKYKDHALTGNYKGFRDCHIKPDLVLIYRVQSDTVDLVRLGSHSAVFY